MTAPCCDVAPYCGHEPNLPEHLRPERTLLDRVDFDALERAS